MSKLLLDKNYEKQLLAFVIIQPLIDIYRVFFESKIQFLGIALSEWINFGAFGHCNSLTNVKLMCDTLAVKLHADSSACNPFYECLKDLQIELEDGTVVSVEELKDIVDPEYTGTNSIDVKAESKDSKEESRGIKKISSFD